MKEKNKKNNVKYIIYALILLIFMGFLGYSLVQSQTKAFEDGLNFGEKNTINKILHEINEDGEVIIETSQGNITLLSLKDHNQKIKEYTKTIIETANNQGYVNLKHEDEQATLIKLEIPQ